MSQTYTIKDLILKSFRTAKQATKTAVKEWMDNYKAFLTTRNKLPYGFTSKAHMDNFFNELKNIFDKYDLEDIDDITITGSVLTKTDPPDLDLVKTMSGSDITYHLNRLEKIFDDAKDSGLLDPDIITHIENGFNTHQENKVKYVRNVLCG